MSLTRIEKYSERGYILKNPPGRLLIVTYWTALGVWLTPGGRRFEPTKSPKWPFFSLFSFFSFFFFFAPRFATLTVDPLIVLSSPSPIRGYFKKFSYSTRSMRKKPTARGKRKAHPAVAKFLIKRTWRSSIFLKNYYRYTHQTQHMQRGRAGTCRTEA